MKRVLLAIGLVAALMNMPAMAADAVKIGFVDVQKVIFTSQAGQKIKKEIDSLVAKNKDGFKKQEKEIQAMQKKFEKEKLTLSKSQKEKKQKAFQEKVVGYKKAVAALQQKAKKKEADYTRKALKQIKDIVNDIAKKDKYNILLEVGQSGLLYADDDLDLTQRVLKQFNIRFDG